MERWDPDAAVTLMLAERCTHMAGATPFLDGLLAAARAGGHPAAGSQGVHLRRRLGAAVADPQGRRLFRPCAGDPGLRLDRGAGDHRRLARRRRPCRRHRRPPRHRRRQAASSTARSAPADPQMLVGYLHPEDEPTSFDAEGYFRTGDLGRWVDDDYLRRDGPREGHHHPQRREHLAQGGRGPSHRPPRHRRDRDRRPARRPDRRAGLRGHRARRPTPDPTSTSCGTSWSSKGVAKFKVPEQVVHLGRAAEERRGQGPQAPDPGELTGLQRDRM